jgi:dienelactone hydrolase
VRYRSGEGVGFDFSKMGDEAYRARFMSVIGSVNPDVERLSAQGVEGVVERVPGTSHGFAMADLRVYDPAATDRHFERTLDLWRRNLSGERAGV